MKKWDRPHISRAVWLVPGNVNLVQALQKNTDWLGIQLGSRREISFCIRYDRDYVAIILSLKNLTRLNLTAEQKPVHEKHFFQVKNTSLKWVTFSNFFCLWCVLTHSVGFSYKQGWPMCFERGIKYQIWSLKISFPVFWLVTGINLRLLASYSPLLWCFLICGRILL